MFHFIFLEENILENQQKKRKKIRKKEKEKKQKIKSVFFKKNFWIPRTRAIPSPSYEGANQKTVQGKIAAPFLFRFPPIFLHFFFPFKPLCTGTRNNN